jgi:hypothetical protein
MANQTLLNDYMRLSMTNYEYGRLRPRWQFLLDSFMGGDDYRRAGYLTKYVLEQTGEYNARLLSTPLDNHCASIISTYLSFLFRNDIERDFADWEDRLDVESFLEDCDFEGRSFNAFMKDVAQWASVFGHCWVMMNKPNIGATTLADELAGGVRPYMSVITPLVVNDWTWERDINGQYRLVYLKYIEEVMDKITILREWTPETIKTWVLDDNKKEAQIRSEEPNQLGMIPAVLVYNRKSIVRGQGTSDIGDIADVQRMIYNLTSEIEQSIRLDGHPTLVVPPTAQVGSGAGAMIILQDGSDPGLNPFYLQTNGSNVQQIRETIAQLIDGIDKMANTGAIRGVRSQTMASGVAMETEFQLLNARLAEKADALELAEEQIWKLFGIYQGADFAGYIKYPDSFSMRDVQREYNELNSAKTAASDPATLALVDYRVRELLDDPNLPAEPATHLSSQGLNEAGPQKTGPTTVPGARPRRYFSSTTTGLE